MAVFSKGAVLSLALSATSSAFASETNSLADEAFMRSIHSVHASCDRDVSLLCTGDDPFMSLLSNSSPFRSTLYIVPVNRNNQEITSDPFSDVLENMIDTSMKVWNAQIVDEANWETEMKAVEEVFDGLLDSFFGQLISPVETRNDSRSQSTTEASDSSDSFLGAEGHGVWRFDEAANLIAAHGEKILQQEDLPKERRHLARRLTVVPEKAKPCLAYGCCVDRCLWKSYDEGSLSSQCHAALDVARTTFELTQSVLQDAPEVTKTPLHSARNMEETQNKLEDEKNNLDEIDEALEEAIVMDTMMIFFFSTFLLPLSLFVIFRSIFGRHRRALHWFRQNPEKRRLKRDILNAVYGNEEIKAKVQEVVEMDLGDEVPLPPHCRDDAAISPQQEGNKCVGCLDRFFLSLPLASLAALLIYTSVTNPSAVLAIGGPAIIIMTGYVILKSFYGCMSNCCCIEKEDSATDFELQGREPLLEESGGNDTGVCHNCDVESMSNCGSCGCCVNCCNCGVEEGSPFIVML